MSDRAAPVPHSPTDGLSYDPSEPVYWDGGALAKEIERTFRICQDCRLCIGFCDSFPSLFSFVDERHDGDVHEITDTETAQVMDGCFQCRLCEIQCPYTVRDGHEYQLDFPRLVHRYRAQRARERGTIPLRDKILGDPDRTAKVARAGLGAGNALGSRSTLRRRLLEKAIGIHRDRELPRFPRMTFERWAIEEGLVSDSPDRGEAVLFQTCHVQHNEPEIGRDTVEVLRANAVDVTCEKGLTCCGMPAWESGDLDTVRAKAAANLALLLPHVEAGKVVLAINPTCSMMLRQDYPDLVDPRHRATAEKVAVAVTDPSEFLWSIRDEDRFDENFASTPGDVAYHAPCHLRAQLVGFRSRDLIRRIPGVTLTTTMACCGHGGTHAMRTEGFEVSVRIGTKAFVGMQTAADAGVWATDCTLAASQFAQHTGRRPMHPMSILARAYRADGFPTPVVPTQNHEV